MKPPAAPPPTQSAGEAAPPDALSGRPAVRRSRTQRRRRTRVSASPNLDGAIDSETRLLHLEAPVHPQKHVCRFLSARHRLRHVHADDAEIEAESHIGSESPEPREAVARVLERAQLWTDQPAPPCVDECDRRRLHRETDAAEPDWPGVQKIEQRRVQLVSVFQLRQRDALALRGIAGWGRASAAALRYVDRSR